MAKMAKKRSTYLAACIKQLRTTSQNLSVVIHSVTYLLGNAQRALFK